MDRVFPDTNVLYPISVADITLRLGDAAVVDIVWSEDLLTEVERVLIEYKGLSTYRAAYFCTCIRTAFPHGEVVREDYEHLVASCKGPDPDDHCHAAAAVAGNATVLLTNDHAAFPPDDVGSIRVATPDEYLTELLEMHTEPVLKVIRNMGSQRREPQTVDMTLHILERAGLVSFGPMARKLLSRAG